MRSKISTNHNHNNTKYKQYTKQQQPTTHLVEGDDERRAALLEHVKRLDGLRLQRVHEIDHQDRHVTQGGTW